MGTLVEPFSVLFDYLQIVTVLKQLWPKLCREQRLDGPFRSRLVEELERLLLNRQRFELYAFALAKVLGPREPAGFEIDEKTYCSLINNGLSVLSDQDLLRLSRDSS